MSSIKKNTKVLLHKRKRHTARRVESAHFADLSPDRGGGTPSSLGQGYTPPSLGWGVPHPDLGWGTPLSGPGMGYPPVQTWDGGPLPPNGGQTENITFRHPSDAGSIYHVLMASLQRVHKMEEFFLRITLGVLSDHHMYNTLY